MKVNDLDGGDIGAVRRTVEDEKAKNYIYLVVNDV